MSNPFRDRLQACLGTAYTIERELGGGGMSRVFVADETSLGRKVVVKVLPAEMAGAVSGERFKREIQLAARLQHPHIVPLLSAGEIDGIPYYTMPYVSGESLRVRIAQGPLTLAEATRILREVASALGFAHSQGVVHRDIKPDNVLLSGGIAAVTDFGVAKAVSAAATEADASGMTSGITSFGMALGTPTYMSPEQATADPAMDHRADIYSLGCLGYEMLTGAPPFTGRSAQRLLVAHVQEAPEPLERKRPDVPPVLSALIMRCLAKSAEDRPQTAVEVVHSLDDLTTPSGGRQPVATAAAAATPLLSGRGRWLAVAAAVVVIAGAWVAFAKTTSSDGTGAAVSQTKSIAVLPFDNLSGDKENEYFSVGIAEEITGALAKLPGLDVAARSVAAAAHAKGGDLKQLGQSLGVGAVLQGSVQRAGSRVRISAQLVNTTNGFQIWSDQYDRELKDVFAVQDEIAKAIVSNLQVRLGGGARPLVRAATGDPEAHALYLQGLYLWNRRTISNIQRAISSFEQAIARDSSYALAHAGLALSYVALPDYSDVDTKAAVDKALASARRAIALDSTLAEPYAAIGLAQAKMWRNAESQNASRHAIALDSTFATAHHWSALHLANVGKFDEAQRGILRARELEPASLIINSNVARIFYVSRKFDQAAQAARKTIELDSAFPGAHEHLGAVLLQQGKYDEAIRELQKRIQLAGNRPSQQIAMLGHAYATAGQRDQARAILSELVGRSKSEAISQGGVAMLYSALGENDKAIQALGLAVERHDPLIQLLAQDPRFDRLRQDPRGVAIFRRAGVK